ncbi:peptide chain release factor subunit 3 [Pancytospora philotis]|nr:peptide chain release factor subunit 3 [Pancytospora philotis]
MQTAIFLTANSDIFNCKQLLNYNIILLKFYSSEAPVKLPRQNLPMNPQTSTANDSASDPLVALDRMSITPERLLNIIFVGHVDAGKSTICGRMLVDLGRIDARTLEKYKQQSTDLNRASWYLSWCMDLNPEEREKGTTTEVGTASFDLPRTRINVLDAPGHKRFVCEMIDAASRADVGVLIVSARLGEFEAGFKGGSTKEHLLLLKSGSVDRLVVLVNKMDECEWAAERYTEIVEKVEKYARRMFSEMHFIPISGYGGENLTKRYTVPFYDGPSFIELLDGLRIVDKKSAKPCMSVIEKIKTSGSAYLYVKVDSGSFNKNAPYKILPSLKDKDTIDRIVSIANEDDVEVAATTVGETYKIKLKDNSEDVRVGMKIVSVDSEDFAACSELYAQLMVLEVNKALTIGYAPIMHINQQTIPCKIAKIVTMEKKSVRIARKGEKVIVQIKLESPVVVSQDKEKPDRFSLRDEALTIASGIIKKIIN